MAGKRLGSVTSITTARQRRERAEAALPVSPERICEIFKQPPAAPGIRSLVPEGLPLGEQRIVALCNTVDLIIREKVRVEPTLQRRERRVCLITAGNFSNVEMDDVLRPALQLSSSIRPTREEVVRLAEEVHAALVHRPDIFVRQTAL